MLVCLAQTKLNINNYAWYVYDDFRTASFDVSEEFDFSLKKGDKFGLKKAKGNYFLVDATHLYVQFKLKPKDAERILLNSKSYNGKIGRTTVKPGTEAGKDRRRLVENNRKEVRVNSTMIHNVWYDEDKQELYVTFPNGSEWKYLEVKPLEVEKLERATSQGKWFNTYIKGIKDSERFEHS